MGAVVVDVGAVGAAVVLSGRATAESGRAVCSGAGRAPCAAGMAGELTAAVSAPLGTSAVPLVPDGVEGVCGEEK